MSTLITIIHVIICFILIIAVLLQSGKSADLAGAFGGAGSQTVFGARGAGTFLSKLTTISAILFMVTSMGLWILSAGKGKSVVEKEKAPQEKAETVKDTSKQNPEQKTQTSGTVQQEG
ncbi:MAG: preprotein translocase subunit SecG [Candidatus Aminicenantaceae bacterium]